MKKISIVVPCYNEEENVREIAAAIVNIVEKELPEYDYELMFADNDSQDKTREYLRAMCAENSKIKAIFNTKNFGQFNSPYHAMCQTTGDCTISMCCDFQDPVEMIPKMVHAWEQGYKIVCAVKTTSRENKFIRSLRTLYYKIIKKLSDVEQIEHFTGFGLYDKKFINVLKELDDPTPFLRGIVGELGFKRIDIPYEQQERRAGKTHNNFATLYDAAMLSVTSYTKVGIRAATIVGFIIAVLSIIIGIVYFILKLTHWYDFKAGTIPILLLVLFFGAVQLFLIGILGEYIFIINKRVMKRPLVVEEERLNFDDSQKIKAGVEETETKREEPEEET